LGKSSDVGFSFPRRRPEPPCVQVALIVMMALAKKHLGIGTKLTQS
jgi:hypothetical protein